jgi:DNA repair exonuclease SbcCD ATPase subunit
LFSFEKNPNELKGKLDELRKQFESCHDMISRVEGIDTTIDDQRSELEKLDNELKSKTELLKKHIQMCKFDLNMPPKPTRITSETEEDLANQSSQNPTNAMNINDDDDDDDELFQSDDNTNLQQETHNENLSPFF